MIRTQEKWDFAELNHDSDLLRSIGQPVVVSVGSVFAVPDAQVKMSALPVKIATREGEKQPLGVPGADKSEHMNTFMGTHVPV